MGPSGFDDRNVRGLFLAAYEATFAGSYAEQLGMLVPSTRGTETYGFLGANAAMREWIGARRAAVLNKTQFSIMNREYENTIAIKQSDLERDATGMLQARLNTFASDAGADHWQSLLVDLINANGLCYDGQNFFDTDHSFGDSGTQKNELTATEVPSANVTTADAPTPTEMANVILEQTAYMLGIVNDQGRPVNGQARNFHIQVQTPRLFSAAMQAISGNLLTGNVDSPLTGMKVGGFKYTVGLEPRINHADEAKQVHLYRTDGGLKPFILQSERELEVDVLGKGSDFYFDNRAVKLGVNVSRAVGYGLWEFASRVTLS
jgi:phage major head subunit gpT-like protein